MSMYHAFLWRERACCEVEYSWKMALYKSREECRNKLLMVIPVSQLSHTDCTCLILAHDSLTRLRCLAISWLDHRWLQASKRLTSKRATKTTPVQIVCSHNELFDTKTTYQVPGTTQWQPILCHEPYIRVL